ncbi:intermembrane phospholipid transport protein YdbH family protein [Nitrosomonas supralitoralis]|uniref:Dienelactone hydrolase n=1 Tax=Nitrosomonas supralitoralis TaxID=2116706 RepID=A0A2P7NUJ0_9PROT|nr:YdbH domain-containing protein [Nitrosomonas supralitoralis]PSJ17105.1 dienelactone hydrolase [Nitrosomonas supralitoralis]
MAKQLKTGLLVLLSLIIFAGVGLYAFRNSLLEMLINDQLSKQDLPLQSISFLDISLNSFHLRDLKAGKNDELHVSKVLVTWQMSDLLAGKPVSVEISGLQVALDLAGERSALNSMQLVTASPGKDFNIPWLPLLELKDSAIQLQLAAGSVTIVLSGSIAQDLPGTQLIQLNTMISSSLGRAKTGLTATLDAQGKIQGTLTVTNGMLSLPEAKISSFSGQTAFALAALQLQHVQTEFALSGIKLPRKTSAKPVPELIGEKPDALALRDAAIDHISFKGVIRELSNYWEGEIDLGIDGVKMIAGPVKIKQLSVNLPMQVKFNSDNWHIGLRSHGKVSLGKISTQYPLRFRTSPAFTIPQADLELIKSPQGLVLKNDITVMPADLTLLVKRKESPEIEINLHPGKITATGEIDADGNYQGQVTISDTSFNLPNSQIQLKDISATLHLNDSEIGNAAVFAVGQLRHQVPEPLFAALSITGDIRNRAKQGESAEYALRITGGIPGLQFLKIKGTHALNSGNGALKAEIIPLNFFAGGLQPSTLFPLLAQLDNVSGQASAMAQLKWSTEGIRSSQGSFEMRNISFAREKTKIMDLNIALSLNNLISLSSSPGQKITARQIDYGIPLENLLVSFQILDTIPPQVALEKVQFSLMNGLVSVAPVIIDPVAKRSDMLIGISNIDLESFFNLIKVEGLTGSGHLDGQIPLSVESNQLTIKNGQLTAKAPGTLHFQSAKASQWLASAGEEMNLLLQAMQDFHYTELSLNLDKSVTHNLVAKLSLLGNNPMVKEGQDFRLNIRLETDIDKILEEINYGYNLSHEILRGSFRLH